MLFMVIERFEGNDMVLVLEACEGGDLAGTLKQHREEDRPLTEQQIWTWFLQVCDALFHMHGQRMMHRDIKPSNIFVTGDGQVKVGDLGLSRFMSSQTVEVQSMVGTPCYMSPEVREGRARAGGRFGRSIWEIDRPLNPWGRDEARRDPALASHPRASQARAALSPARPGAPPTLAGHPRGALRLQV